MNWKKLGDYYLKGYGVFIALFFIFYGIAVVAKWAPNFISNELLTMLVLCLVAIQQLEYWFRVADGDKK